MEISNVENVEASNALSSFYIVYYGSCNLEKPGIYGISHLMEHLVCKLFDHLQNEFDENGISWNAYTSSSEVVFHWSGLEENLSKYREVLIDLLSEFKITEEEFENERNIVIQEYYDSFNDQTSMHYLNLNRKLYDHYGPIGLLEDLKSLTFDDCKKYFDLQFKTIDKIVNVSDKKIESSKNTDSSFKDFDEYSKEEDNANKFYYDIKNNDKAKMEVLNEYKGKRSIIAYSDLIDNKEDIPYITFIIYMLTSGLNSPVYKQIREKEGLVYYIQCWLDRVGDKSVIYFASLTTDENVEKFEKSLNKVLNDYKKHLNKERFDIIKNKLIIGYKKSDINRHTGVEKYISPKEFVLENYINDITLEKCLEICEKYFLNFTHTTDLDFSK